MLTQEEKELIIAALAFASTEDVVADFTPQQEERMSELAVRLREEYDISELSSVYIPYKSHLELKRYASDPSIVSKYTDFIPFD